MLSGFSVKASFLTFWLELLGVLIQVSWNSRFSSRELAIGGTFEHLMNFQSLNSVWMKVSSRTHTQKGLLSDHCNFKLKFAMKIVQSWMMFDEEVVSLDYRVVHTMNFIAVRLNINLKFVWSQSCFQPQKQRESYEFMRLVSKFSN